MRNLAPFALAVFLAGCACYTPERYRLPEDFWIEWEIAHRIIGLELLEIQVYVDGEAAVAEELWRACAERTGGSCLALSEIRDGAKLLAENLPKARREAWDTAILVSRQLWTAGALEGGERAQKDRQVERLRRGQRACKPAP